MLVACEINLTLNRTRKRYTQPNNRISISRAWQTLKYWQSTGAASAEYQAVAAIAVAQLTKCIGLII